MVRVRGLKLWPVSTSDVFVEEFHFGLLPITDCGRCKRLPVGVVEPSLLGVERAETRGVRGFRAICDEGVGSADCLRLLGWGRWLPTLDERCFVVLALPGLGIPSPDIMTEEGGELCGVSMPLPVVDLSFESMLEMESRSCCPLLSCWMSSTRTSSSAIRSLSSCHFACISVCKRMISPLTVKRSFTPLSMIDSTLSIAGP